MLEQQIVVEALTQYRSLWLIVMAVAFAALEPFLPHHPVDRRRDLRLDILGVGAGIVFVMISYGLLRWFGALVQAPAGNELLRALRDLPPALKLVVVVIAVDCAIYWLHAFMHRWEFSWRMHRWHHSIEEMYWFAGFRASFFHVLLYAIPQVAVPVIIFDLSLAEMMVATGVANFVQLWTHTNLKVNLGPLGWLFVTPDYHRVHHRAGNGPVKNLGNLLTVWDRFFGTHERPRRSPVGRLGLAEPRPSTLRMVLGV